MREMVIVVKIGGSILKKGMDPKILRDLKDAFIQKRVLLVHGGGDQVTEIAEKLGKSQKFVVSPGGIRSRYTDWETVVIFTMVMVGKINKVIVTALHKAGIKALGLSGVDASVIRAERKKKLIIINERGRKMMIDGGYTGKIKEVNSDLLNLLLDKGYMPVIAPIAIGDEGELLNVDGDRAAAYIAGSIKADKIIFLTDVPGVFLDGKPISKISILEAKEIMPKIGFGMEKKVLASLEAVSMGVKESIITSGIIEEPLKLAIEHKTGTVIYSG
ncbi:MAG: [LysW]-aminoadipate/[LysW]-glutamate kinase [Candidatus Methylarchaceae archaeon HK02M1]|nr:[LysW]-aminoadipate/[LysW]-glutamate kinase [Candidatus Methylarchaceae archaeon HK01M]MCP8311602.1 [LysW]-aminoadipate/[LysW]-glutamate kinase [Candidatus Methylarchaceae archaeon HK02M1]